MRLEFTSRFQRAFKKLPKDLQQIAGRKIDIFREAQFHPILHTHKLTIGDLWAFSVDYKNRIVFEFHDDVITLLNIGDHSIYRNLS